MEMMVVGSHGGFTISGEGRVTLSLSVCLWSPSTGETPHQEGFMDRKTFSLIQLSLHCVLFVLVLKGKHLNGS